MNLYFLPILSDKVNYYSELTFLNSPGNQRAMSRFYTRQSSCKYELYQRVSNEWIVLDQIDSKKSSYTLISSKNYQNTLKGDLILVVPVLRFSDRNSFDVLPTPVSKKVELTPYADRALLTIRSSCKKSFHSSYSSEYPIAMTKKKLSLLTSGITMSSNSIKKYAFFVNIFNSKNDETGQISFFEKSTRDIVKIIDARENSSNFTDLSDIADPSSIVISSRNFGGIPIFLEIFESGHLSMEHTHPPSEYFISNERFLKSSLLKKNWFNSLYKNA